MLFKLLEKIYVYVDTSMYSFKVSRALPDILWINVGTGQKLLTYSPARNCSRSLSCLLIMDPVNLLHSLKGTFIFVKRY